MGRLTFYCWSLCIAQFALLPKLVPFFAILQPFTHSQLPIHLFVPDIWIKEERNRLIGWYRQDYVSAPPSRGKSESADASSSCYNIVLSLEKFRQHNIVGICLVGAESHEQPKSFPAGSVCWPTSQCCLQVPTSHFILLVQCADILHIHSQVQLLLFFFGLQGESATAQAVCKLRWIMFKQGVILRSTLDRHSWAHWANSQRPQVDLGSSGGSLSVSSSPLYNCYHCFRLLRQKKFGLVCVQQQPGKKSAALAIAARERGSDLVSGRQQFFWMGKNLIHTNFSFF